MKNNRIIGALVGVIFAVLLIYLGFWKTIIIGIGATIGFLVTGEKIEYKDKVFIIIEKILSLELEYLGILGGIIIGILVLSIGLFKTIFIAILAFIGYYLSKKFSNKHDFFEFLDKILPPGKI